MTVNRAMLDTVFGSDNINLWADMNNNGVPADLTARVDWAIALGTSKVQSKVKPLTYLWTAVITDPQIEHMIALQAGLLLYANRRVIDEQGASINPMARYEKEYEKFFRDLAGGKIALEAARTNRPYPVATI